MKTPDQQICFLVCNAHIDPVWLWHWEDGLTETISTFRVAADFCDDYPEFVFNHNESLLYEWIERNDAVLFKRIQKLVKAGRWHIAGGAYLQPDLIGASGESIVRHFLVGKRYFAEKFGQEPTTAYNFDSFGHSQGIVQILAGSGFDSYVFCRPNRDPKGDALKLPVGSFRWQHPSGAEIIGRRSDDHYLTNRELGRIFRDGKWPDFYKSEGDFMFLWGIGNHGGGPSRAEYAQIAKLRKEFPAVKFIESTPEAFFRHTLKVRGREKFPVYQGELKPHQEGCYTSMQRVKTRHRYLENLIHLTEKLAAIAWWEKKHVYPATDLTVAWKDILFAEFHDILPGSGIPKAEEDALNLLGHAEEILRRKKAEILISLFREEPLAERNATPIFVYNPHSWEVTQEVEIEYCIDQQFGPDEVVRRLYQDGKEVPAQFERAENNLDDPHWGEWRRRAVFLATIPPLSYQRFDANYSVLTKAETVRWKTPPLPRRTTFEIDTGSLKIALNLKTGLIDRIESEGKNVVTKGSFQPLVYPDTTHSWFTLTEWTEPVGAFALATPQQAARIMGSDFTNAKLAEGKPPISIIEDGPIRLVIEAIFVYGQSYLVQRYFIAKHRPVLRVDQTIFWAEHDKMLRLQIAHAPVNKVEAERCYSIDDVTATEFKARKEQDYQHFLRFTPEDGGAFAVVSHGTHGYRRRGTQLLLSVLRSPSYGAMTVENAGDSYHNRYIPRHDQGVRQARFTLLFGTQAATTDAVVRGSYEHNVPFEPFVYFPTQHGQKAPKRRPFLRVSAPNVVVTVLKKAEDGEDLVIRLWETGGKTTKYRVELDGKRFPLEIGPWQLRTYRLTRRGKLTETDLLERAGRAPTFSEFIPWQEETSAESTSAEPGAKLSVRAAV
jgi:alpha-mannosidase